MNNFETRLMGLIRDIELPQQFVIRLSRDSVPIDLPSGPVNVPGRYYLQIKCWRQDVITKEMGWGFGGKAYLSEFAADLEIVTTVFGLYKSYVEHEARETFLYQGYRIFGPHNALPGLIEAAKTVDIRSAKHTDDQPLIENDPPLCDSWIWIDGGNDKATCQEFIHGPDKKHFRSGVGEWTDADHRRSLELDHL